MKVLFNATTVIKGGAVQNTTDFILHALRDPGAVEFQFAISSVVANELRRSVQLPQQTEVFERSPARHRASRRRLADWAQKTAPQSVFTMYGPAYVRFAVPHVMGFADGWVSHSTWLAWRAQRFPRAWFSQALGSLYKLVWIRRADAWIVQTEAARQGLHRRARMPLDRIAVVSNTCGQQYQDRSELAARPAPGARWRILCFAAAYAHKGIDILPDVASHLERLQPTLDFEIVVTLPPEHPLWQATAARAKQLGAGRRIVNLGPIPVADGPALYRSCQICLLPTLLETFSATYPEAMAMGLPIVTTDLDFARAICHEAALYFPPRKANAAAQQIANLITDPALWERQIQQGRRVLAALPNAQQVYESLVRTVQQFAAR